MTSEKPSNSTDSQIYYSVVVPVYNESQSAEPLFKAFIAEHPDMEIVVVDDGSDNNGLGESSTQDVVSIRHPYNIGNGAAVKSGIRAASGKVIVFMDGDGQHDPADIPKLLEHMDRFDMVVGARTNAQHASWLRRLMNGIFNRLGSYVTGFPIKDLTSGFRAMRADTACDLLPLLPNGFSWPTTSTLVLLRSGMSVKYVPINARPRIDGRSHIRPVRDSLRFFRIIMKICTLYSPFRIFLPVSGTMFLLGLVNYAYTFFAEGRFTNMSALMFSSAVIIFMMGLVSEQISQVSLLRHPIRRIVHNARVEEKPEDHRHRN